MRSERRVSREIYAALTALDYETAPQSPVAIVNSAAGEVQRRHAMDGCGLEWQRFAPIQLMHGPDILRAEQRGDARRNNIFRIPTCRQPPQGRQVKVIVM